MIGDVLVENLSANSRNPAEREPGRAPEPEPGPVPEPEPRPAAEAEPKRVRGPRLDHRQRVFLWITSGAALLAVGGLVGSTEVKSPAQLAAAQGPPSASLLTAEVRDQVLAQQVVTRGSVVADGSVTVDPTAAQGAGPLVVTRTPVAVGAAIKPGQVIVEVSGRPVIALPGKLPAYRDLKPGESGADITELQAALKSLGYGDGDDPGFYGTETRTAVGELYQRLGYDPVTAGGSGGAGDQALRADAQAVAAARQSVLQAQAALFTAQAATPFVQQTVTIDQQILDSAQEALGTAEDTQQQDLADTGDELPRSEFVFVPAFPATLASLNGKVGATVTSPLATVASGGLVVTATLDRADGKLLRQGMNAQILAEGLGLAAGGTLTTLGPYSAGSSPGAGGAGGQQPGYPVTVTPSGPLTGAAWLGQNVRLTFTTAQSTGKVLAVPVSAISTGADGSTTVTVVDPGNVRRQVPVQVGMTANGMCQITPRTKGAVRAGQSVVTGR